MKKRRLLVFCAAVLLCLTTAPAASNAAGCSAAPQAAGAAAVPMRRWLLPAAALAALAATGWVVWSKTTVLQEALIRLICLGSAGGKPPDYGAVLEAVETLGTDVSYESRFQSGTMDLYAKRSDVPQPLLVYAHGGYYVGGDKRGFACYCRKLASFGYVVASVNYALAPEGRYPTQILQINEAVSFLLARADRYDVDPSRVFIAGDSAGGHLASQMGLYYTNAAFRAAIGGAPALEGDRLRGVILLCGYYRMDTLRATKFPLIVDAVWMLTGEKRFEGTAVAARMDTAAQLTEDYPAVFLTCGDQDPFITQAREMLDALRLKGVDTTAHLPVSGRTRLKHEYQADLRTAEGRTAMEETARFLQLHCARRT